MLHALDGLFVTTQCRRRSPRTQRASRRDASSKSVTLSRASFHIDSPCLSNDPFLPKAIPTSMLQNLADLKTLCSVEKEPRINAGIKLSN